MIKAFDSHVHLTDERYTANFFQQIIDYAKKHNVKMIIPSVDCFDSLKASEIAERESFLFFAVGLHPHNADKFEETELIKFEQLLKHKKCKAVGEIGLDYFYDNSSRAKQALVFEKMVKIALPGKKPLIIHSREAEQEAFAILKKFKLGKVVFHSYTGKLETLKKIIEQGWFVSLNGMITFKKNENLLEIAKNTPPEQLLIETDGPYLSPVPMRGKPNRPEYLDYVVAKAAELYGLNLGDFVLKVNSNFERFFDV